MKIAIVAVTGAGSRIAAEALRRGHSVTGIVRSPENADAPEGVTVHKADATQPEHLAPRLRGQDAVISAATFQVLRATPLLQAVKASSVKRPYRRRRRQLGGRSGYLVARQRGVTSCL